MSLKFSVGVCLRGASVPEPLAVSAPETEPETEPEIEIENAVASGAGPGEKDRRWSQEQKWRRRAGYGQAPDC